MTARPNQAGRGAGEGQGVGQGGGARARQNRLAEETAVEWNSCMIDTSVMKNMYALCAICTSRAMSSAQIHLLCRTCIMHSVASVPPELCHLHRYICYEERVCTLWHLHPRAMSSAQIHLLWRTCMHSVASAPQSYVICTDTSVMKNMYSMHSVAFVPSDLYHLNRYVICTEHIYSHVCSIYALRDICTFRALWYVQYRIYLSCWTYAICSTSDRCHEWRQIIGTVPSVHIWISITHKTEDGTFLSLYPRHFSLLSSIKGYCLRIFRDQKFMYLINYSETGTQRRLCLRRAVPLVFLSHLQELQKLLHGPLSVQYSCFLPRN